MTYQPEKAILTSYDAMVLEAVDRRLAIELAASELEIPLKRIIRSYNRIIRELRKQGGGQRIKGSPQSRSFCPRCLAPTRNDGTAILRMCMRCDPPHMGCSSSSPPGTDGLDGDPDAFGRSWITGK